MTSGWVAKGTVFEEIRPWSSFKTGDFVEKKLGGLPQNESTLYLPIIPNKGWMEVWVFLGFNFSDSRVRERPPTGYILVRIGEGAQNKNTCRISVRSMLA